MCEYISKPNEYYFIATVEPAEEGNYTYGYTTSFAKTFKDIRSFLDKNKGKRVRVVITFGEETKEHLGEP